MALAHWMHYDLQVTQRKVATIMQELTGVQVTQGALAQDAQRRARHLEDDYQAEREKVRQSEVAHTDDTGWRVAASNAQLMTFTTEPAQDPTTVYQIRERHRNEEVREVLPQDWDGVMVTDRGKSYDAKQLRALGSEVEVNVHTKGRLLTCSYRADLICFPHDMPVLVELKACERLTHAHRAQVIHYMKATQIQRALLMNFGGTTLQFERMGMGWDG